MSEPEVKKHRSIWHIFRALLPIAVMSLVGEFAYSVMNVSILPLYLRSDVGLSEEKIGLVIVVFLATEALLKSYFGQLGDRVGRKPLMVMGPLLSCLSAVVIMRTHHMGLIFPLRVLDGIGAAALWPAMFTLTAHKVEEEDRTTAMSILNFTYIAGVALGFSSGRIIWEGIELGPLAFQGIQGNSFYVVSILFALTSLVAMLLVRDEPHRHVQTEPLEAHAGVAPDVGWRDLLHGFLAAPSMAVIIGVAFIGVGMLMGIATFFTKDVLDIPPHEMPLLFLPVAGAVALISIPVGRFVDRWSKANAIKLGLALCAAAMIAMGSSRHLALVVVSSIALGIGFIMASPAWLALISTLTTPQRRGAVIGAMGTAQGIGALLGPYFGGLLYSEVSYQAPFIASGILLAISLVMALFVIHDPNSKHQIE